MGTFSERVPAISVGRWVGELTKVEVSNCTLLRSLRRLPLGLMDLPVERRVGGDSIGQREGRWQAGNELKL
jgi:hypothetical protein